MYIYTVETRLTVTLCYLSSVNVKKQVDDGLLYLVYFSVLLFLSANGVVKYLRLLKKLVLYYCISVNSLID
jgi:hypothetical protein